MKLESLHQPPFETTQMGVVRAVLDYHGHEFTDAVAYGGSGHAFLVNVHEALCPSSPYCWNYDGFIALLGNLGLRMTGLGFFHTGTGAEERAAVEKTIRERLDQGVPCSLCNMDNQLVYGYDEEKFFTARPWPKNPDYPPGELTFGKWTEFGEECHVSFFVFEKTEPAERALIFRDSLRYAIDLHRNPGNHQCDGYAVGPGAFDNWAGAAAGHLASHGNWWNGTVWGECRARAAEYFEEMAEEVDAEAAGIAGELSGRYRGMADRLNEIRDKELAAERKIEIARDLKAEEEAALPRIEALLARIG